MRAFFFCLGLGLYAATSFAQTDSMRQEPPTISPIVGPANSAPFTTPAATIGSETGGIQPNVRLTPKKGRRRTKTVPPSDANSFGVGVEIDKNKDQKKDTNP